MANNVFDARRFEHVLFAKLHHRESSIFDLVLELIDRSHGFQVGEKKVAENYGLMFGQVINYAWEKERRKIING